MFIKIDLYAVLEHRNACFCYYICTVCVVNKMQNRMTSLIFKNKYSDGFLLHPLKYFDYYKLIYYFFYLQLYIKNYTKQEIFVVLKI